MKYGLIGEKLPHSFSAMVHGAIGGYDYELKELHREELEAFITAKEFCGINVTVPYKEQVIPYLDKIDPLAAEIGAVNTVVNRDGVLYGYNTDISGMLSLIERMGLELKGKKVLVLGTGGTSKTAAAAAKHLEAATVIKVSRRGKDGAVSYEEAVTKHTDAEIIINTTPCGMYPDNESVPIDLSFFTKLEGVADVIYNPLRSRLVREAKRLGVVAEGGLYMLVKQALLASELFFDTEYGEDTTCKVFSNVITSKENIVLSGMPSSGKTTVGTLLSRLTGRELYDTDKYLEAKHGMSVPDMFSRYGEPKFRDMEAEAVKELSVKNGVIIATGGGAVMRAESADALKQNGRIYFLDRPLAELIPTDDRPMSRTREALEQRYNERYDTYLSTADEVIKVKGTPTDVALSITERHLKL